MAGISGIFILLFVIVSWKSVCSQDRHNFNEMHGFLAKDILHLKDGRPVYNGPDMRFVLNNLLKYENYVRRPTDSDDILTLASRSKDAANPSDDSLAMLASGFHGSRGKRPTDEIPVFANGFPANRGRR